MGRRLTDYPFDPAKLARQAQFQVPDYLEAQLGWRAWGVPSDTPRFGTSPKLYSVSHGSYFWAPRQAAEADCPRCSKPTVREDPITGEKTEFKVGVPGERCTCGFYSANSLQHLMSMTYHMYDADRGGYFHVIGEVANWGKVIRGSQGWRSQFSYPLRLYVPFEAFHLAKSLAQTYGVKVELKNFLKQYEQVDIDTKPTKPRKRNRQRRRP